MSKIFVFGSNLGGIHGAGAALYAYRNHEAQMYIGVGITGNSYAIPTKDGSVNHHMVGSPLPKYVVNHYVNQFNQHAQLTPDAEYQVTRIGCGLAGFRDDEIAPMFRDAPGNCTFDTDWKPWLGNAVRYWGTFGRK